MVDQNKIIVPDIGGETDVDVIEVLVKPGDVIEKDTALITLESDKASMEIPSSKAGKVKDLKLKVGDKVSQGDVILELEESAEQQEQASDSDETDSKNQSKTSETKSEASNTRDEESADHQKTEVKEVSVPDIGGAKDVDVIEVLVKAGDTVSKEQALITLEGDKATMDIPSPYAGKVIQVSLKLGDKVSKGSKILTIEAEADSKPEKAETLEKKEEQSIEQSSKDKPVPRTDDTPQNDYSPPSSIIAAGPAVRRLAREFGVALEKVKGTGRKSRILKEDIQNYVKSELNKKSGNAFSLPQAPEIDFSTFGEVEFKPLNKIKRLTGENLHRAWLTIPHVTQFDQADITDLEAFRKSQKAQAESQSYKLTLLAFITKVVAKALSVYPQFNASLDADKEQLIFKKYFNIGIAVDTPNGLVVPVIKAVDQLSVSDIAKKMSELSQKARDKKLTKEDISGGCFTISSLGGIGGTAFTPVVNHPEVAILGLSKSSIQPVYNGKAFEPRLLLPLSLSYDHRVIDGAEAARFTKYLADVLSDVRKVLL